MTIQELAEELLKHVGTDNLPDDFRLKGQTLLERAEAWVLHAIERLEEELASSEEDEDEE